MRLAKAPNVGAPAASYVLGLAVAGLLTLTACGQQQPAFTEDMKSVRDDSADALARSKVEPLPDERTQAASRDGDAAGSDGSAGDGDSGDNPDSTGGGSTNSGGSTNGGSADGGDGSTTGSGGSDGGVVIPGGTTGGSTNGTAGSDGTGGTTGGTTGGGTTGGTTDGGSADGGADGGVIVGAERTVELTQMGPGKVDILWVVDTSGSMSEEQTYLSQNFSSLINQLAAAGSNFQTAITTTDICQENIPADLSQRVCPVDYGGSSATRLRGSFVGDAGKKVLTQSMPDLVSRFSRYVNQGIDGSGFEHGLKAAEMAITKVVNGQNEPLIRSDAFLAVIVVSDEEDDGIGLSMTDAYTGYNFYNLGLTTFRYTEDNFISYLKGVKGAGRFSVSAIAPTRQSNGRLCSAPHTQPAEEGTQYIKAAAKTGGILQSICDTNWSNSLATIGLDLSAQLTQVVLPSVPDVASIRVTVNGVSTSAWTYNEGNNAVKFNAGSVPAEGAQIKVVYREKT